MYADPSLEMPLSDDYVYPTNKHVGAAARQDPDAACTYLCGNSLGLLSNSAKRAVLEEMDVWASRAVVGHFSHPLHRPWTKICDEVTPLLAQVVGATKKEVACMGTLTNNLHLMMDSFYNPTPQRFKILCEAKAFPSDQYAFASRAVAHGLDPAIAVREISPRLGEYSLREEDILNVIEDEGGSIAIVLFSGVQYYTGQWFPMEAITQKAQEKGCICGWDLAHAVGNVPLELHRWNVDFAVWCSYKYLNSGPGGIGGLFIHEKWDKIGGPKYAGWWGHELSTRFEMPPKFSPISGAQGFQQSTPSMLAIASLLGALQTFEKAGMMKSLRERSVQLTGYLERLLMASKYYVAPNEVAHRHADGTERPGFTIITPTAPSARGAQLSLLFFPVESGVMRKVSDALSAHGVVGDEREPDVIRLAPAPLYNSSKDCDSAAVHLDIALASLEA